MPPSGGRRRHTGEQFPFKGIVDNAMYNSSRLRLARIFAVDSDVGQVGLEWLDHPGGRTEVALTQDSPSSYHTPKVGDVVVCAFDVKDRALILRYMPIGYQARHGDPSEGAFEPGDALREVKSGEHYWKSLGGAEIFMNQEGDIYLTSGMGSYFKVSAEDIVSQNSETWKVKNEAGQLTMGLVRRLEETVVSGETRTFNKIITFGGGTLESGDVALVEWQLKVAEKADADPTTPNTDDPFVTLTMGTLVNSNGDIVNKDGSVVAADADDAVAVDLQVGNSERATGFRLTVKKGGDVEIDIKDGKSFSVGAAGASVLAFGSLADVVSEFIDNYNDHKHNGGSAPIMPIYEQDSITASSYKTSKLKGA